jgi:hypothetical protein
LAEIIQPDRTPLKDTSANINVVKLDDNESERCEDLNSVLPSESLGNQHPATLEVEDCEDINFTTPPESLNTILKTPEKAIEAVKSMFMVTERSENETGDGSAQPHEGEGETVLLDSIAAETINDEIIEEIAEYSDGDEEDFYVSPKKVKTEDDYSDDFGQGDTESKSSSDGF